MTNSTTKDEFEAWFADSRRGKGTKVMRNLLVRRENGDYQEDSTQRHWWTWQNAYLAARRAALLGAMADLQKILEVAGQEDESGIVVAINALHALAGEGMKT